MYLNKLEKSNLREKSESIIFQKSNILNMYYFEKRFNIKCLIDSAGSTWNLISEKLKR